MGTTAYDVYARDYEIACPGRPTLRASADPRYLGSAERHNPEDLLVAALSACHMLWYLHLCAIDGIVVTAYQDAAEGLMQTHADGSGEFTEVTLRPRIDTSADSDPDTAARLHSDTNAMCFIARSVKFPVHYKPETMVGLLSQCVRAPVPFLGGPLGAPLTGDAIAVSGVEQTTSHCTWRTETNESPQQDKGTKTAI